MNLSAQKDKLNGKIKFVKESLIYLDKQPDLASNCLDCDTESLYQFGIILVSSPEDYDVFFQDKWKNSRNVTYKNREQKFNQKGFKTEETWFESDNSIYRKFEYKYDENDSITEIKENHGDTLIFVNKKTFINNLLMSEINFKIEKDNYDNYSYKYFIYNEDKKLIQSYLLNENGFVNSTFYIYNNFGKQIQLNTIDSSNEKRLVWKRLYDEKNRVIVIEEYDINESSKKDSISKKSFFKYNDDNKIIKRIDSYTNFEQEHNLEYDANNFVKRIYVKTTDAENNFEYKYTRKNNRISEVVIKKYNNNFRTSFFYKDDNNGNWIEQTKSVNGKPMYTIKRTIEYF
jgi:hypothetical protein